MSTTVTSTAPKPVEATAKPAQPGARAQDRKAEGGDIFASLLNLLASTQVLPEAATTSLADKATSDQDTPEGHDNPLASLMGWGLPGATDTVLGKKNSAAGADPQSGLPGAMRSPDGASTSATTEQPGSTDGTFDISHMTPVEPSPLEAAPKGAVALPANAVRPGSSFVPTARPIEAATSAAGTTWRHASLASTETQAIQQSANTAQVRSTVALNERFGVAPGVPLANTELREAPGDAFKLTTPAAASRAADATTALPVDNAGGGATGSDTTGGGTHAFEQTDGQPGNPHADAQTGDEPTVTHWGTQHLRHASLSVGGEAGEQAIDIQLSMQGQEVQVAFTTDSAEARASLREHAGESLSDLLAKSGIQLGGVSVGAQGQQGARRDDGAARQNGIRGVAPTASASTAAPAKADPTARRADGSQPLDVFA